MGGTNRRMKGQRPDNIRSLFEVLNPFQNRKIWIFYSRAPSQNFWVYHGRSWRLSNCHIQRQQKWIFLRCLIFKEFIFPKNHENKPPILLNQIVEINLSKPDHLISSQHPIWGFLIVITNFLGNLKSRKEDDFSGNNKSSFENILVSSTEEALILKIKGIFE